MASHDLTNAEMEILTISEMQEMIEHIVVNLNEPCIGEGKSGIGKTGGVEQVCERKDYFYCPFISGQHDTVDFKGMPASDYLHPDTIAAFPELVTMRDDGVFIEDEPSTMSLTRLPAFDAPRRKKFTVWDPMSTMPFEGNPLFPTDRPILLFLDEITSASIPVMAVLYQLIDKRCVGEHKLLPNVRIFCACNRADDKGVMNRMPLPLCNRLTWFEIVMDLEGWSKFIIGRYGAAAGPFVAYFNWMKGELHTYDPDNPRRVFMSPRTGEKACKYFVNEAIPEKIKHAAMAGAIGAAISAKVWGYFLIWQGVQELMVDIEKHPDTAAIPEESSVQWAVALSISGLLTCKNANNYYKYLKRMDGEYCIAGWQMAVAREQKAFKEGRIKKGEPRLYESDPFIDMAKRYKKIFERS